MTNPIDPEALTDELDGVRRLARSLARDAAEADDLVQDTMVAALQNRTQVRSGLGAWLSGVARNVSRRRARAAGRRAHHEGARPSMGTAPSTADVIVRAAEQSRVLDTLVRMEEPYRSAVLLRYIEGLPPRVIARRMALPVETVRTHIKRGLERLRERLTAAHGGHAGEARAALVLAASETLGAGHARAVALARASGLALLLGVGLTLVWALSRDEGAPAEAPHYVSESDLSAPPRPMDEAEPQRPPSAAGPADRSTQVGAGTAPAPLGTEGARLEPAPIGAVPLEPTPLTPEPGPQPSAPAHPPGENPAAPVVPIETQPEPPARVAVEEGGAARKHEEKTDGEGAGEEEAGEFYEGETSFSSRQVGRAIDKGVAWMRKRQGRDGSWGGIKFNATYGGGESDVEGMPAGPTALALYALLKCKVPADDPQIQRGFAWLRKRHEKPASSYETSMLLLAVTATADPLKLSANAAKQPAPKLKGRYRTWATKLVDHLVEKRTARGWRYNVPGAAVPPGGDEDLSSTQLAALSLFAAHRAGIKVKKRVWEDILAFTLAQQEAEGPEVTYPDPVDPTQQRTAHARGFAYLRASEDPEESSPRGGMTACGLANLEMARFVLSEGGARKAAWLQREDAAAVQTALYDGLAWLDRNWSPFEDPQAGRKNVYHIYWLYALERAMDLVNLKLVGTHRWYSESGQALLNRQHANGHWAVRTSGGGHDVLDTSFALLFLKRATKVFIPFGSITGGSDVPMDNR